jgi:hypothetical protein
MATGACNRRLRPDPGVPAKPNPVVLARLGGQRKARAGQARAGCDQPAVLTADAAT